MTVRIYCDGSESPVGPFIATFVGNVCAAVARSLKCPRPVNKIRFELDGMTVRFLVNDAPVALDLGRGFAAVIAADTLRGMVRHLKGIDPEGSLRFDVEMRPPAGITE